MKKFISLCLATLLLFSLFSYSVNAAGDTSAAFVSAYGSTTGVITGDGSLYMWGTGKMIADGSKEHCYRPVKILDDVVSVAIGGYQSNAVTSDGTLWTWGEEITSAANSYYPDEDMYEKPLKLMDDIASVYAGFNSSAAIKNNGDLWVWNNHLPVSVNGTESRTYEPQLMLHDVASVQLERFHFAALKKDGSLWLRGDNERNQIGDNTKDYHFEPVKILDQVVSYSISNYYTAAVTSDGSLYVWGTAYAGEFLSGDAFGTYATPTKIMTDVASVYSVGRAMAVIKTDGSLWMWGEADTQTNNDGTFDEMGMLLEPKKIMDDVQFFTGSNDTFAAIKKDSSLWIWGDNNNGMLGNGTDQAATEPIKVLDDVTWAYCSETHALAMKKDGTLWSWGWSLQGQLGLGEMDNEFIQRTPAQITEFVGEVVPTITIYFELNGGRGTTKISAIPGELISPPDNPEREGYFFAGWYKDKNLTTPWNFDTDVAIEDTTLYAKWLPKTTATVIADPATQEVIIDGKPIIFNTFILRDEQGFDVNFIKLRDVAYLLNGTAAQFNVDWRNNAIRLDKKTAYTTQNGKELTVPTVVSAPAKTSITPVLSGGITAPLEAFRLTDEDGGDHNYFKLRDIGKVAGFQVEWDEDNARIVVTTTKPYKD